MSRLLLVAAALAAVAPPASAKVYELRLTGTFRAIDQLTTAGGGDNLLAADSTYSIRFRFDDAARVPGPPFVAQFAPTIARLTVGGATYDLTPFSFATPGGVAVAIFDQNFPAFPGKYGVGFYGDPLHDGSGIISDYDGATVDYTLPAIAATTYTGYNGSGFSAGPGCGAPGQTCTPEAIALTRGGESFTLTLGRGPETGPDASFSAALVAVPEPASWGLMLSGFAMLGLAARRRRTVPA